VVDLPMGCTTPDSFPQLEYQIDDVDLPGIGTIIGTPPHSSLSVFAATCADEVVIPYIIHEKSGTGMTATGQIAISMSASSIQQ
jgi:hypothetical protein